MRADIPGLRAVTHRHAVPHFLHKAGCLPVRHHADGEMTLAKARRAQREGGKWRLHQGFLEQALNGPLIGSRAFRAREKTGGKVAITDRNLFFVAYTRW